MFEMLNDALPPVLSCPVHLLVILSVCLSAYCSSEVCLYLSACLSLYTTSILAS